MDNFFGKPIFTYTRAEAIADGELVDVSHEAERLFKWPVAVTKALDGDIRDIPATLDEAENYDLRLWDVLWMGMCAIKQATARGQSGTTLLYTLHLPMGSSKATDYRVKLAVGPGDDGEPVVTLMRPDED